MAKSDVRTTRWTRLLLSAWLGMLSMVPVAQAHSTTPKRVSPIIVNQTTVDGIPMMTGQPTPTPPPIAAEAAVVVDLSTGTVVYAKNPLASHYPASLTKVLTALVALQHGRLNEQLVTHQDALDVPPDKLYLVPGEHESLQKFLYGLLLISANDAAIVIADHYGGSVQGFATMMNREANALGAHHTHFVNPNGLPNAHHVTTAYDLALIARAAMANRVFRQIVRTRYYHWQGQAWTAQLTNINQMLFTYPGSSGVKTGWTSAAHETLIASATRNQQTFLAVLLDEPFETQINTDATNLLNYAFATFQTRTLIRADQPMGTVKAPDGKSIPVVALDPVLATTAIGSHTPTFTLNTIRHPVAQTIAVHDRIGTLVLTQADGQVVASDPLLATHSWSAPGSGQPSDVFWLLVLIAFVAGMLRYNRRVSRRLRASAQIRQLGNPHV